MKQITNEKYMNRNNVVIVKKLTGLNLLGGGHIYEQIKRSAQNFGTSKYRSKKLKTKRKTYVQCKYNRWENITLNNQKSTDISKPAKSPALVDTISSSCITSFKSWKQEPNLRPSHPFQENVPKKKNEKSGFMKLGFWGTGRERKLVDMNWN